MAKKKTQAKKKAATKKAPSRRSKKPVVRLSSLDEFQPDPENANEHTEHGMTLLEQSMTERGFARPVFAAKDGPLIGGNLTTEVARRVLDDSDAIVIESDGTRPIIHVRTDVEPGSEKATMLALEDNRVAQASLNWNEGKLIAFRERGIPVDQLWSDDEFREIAQRAKQAMSGGLGVNDPDELEPAKKLQAKWKTKSGQVWEMESPNHSDVAHRLVIGDSTELETYERLMQGQLAEFCYTDPPYGVKYEGGSKKWPMLENDDEVNMYAASFPHIHAHTTPKAPLYLSFGIMRSLSVFAALLDNKFEVITVIIWNKNHAQFGTLSAHYKHKYEPVAYCRKKKKSVAWYGPTNEVTVWDIDRKAKNEFHPTEKPVELVERAIRNSAPPGGIVLDPFGGSGTTLIAAEKMIRPCRIVEQDANYAAVILERWSIATGGKPKRAKAK